MHFSSVTFCCNQWLAARFHPPWFQSTRFHLKQRSQPHPQPYCALPTCNRCLSGLTFAITRSSCVWATCTEGQAAGSLFPALVKPGHLQPGRLLHAVTRHMISQLDTRRPYSKKMVFFTCLAFFALIGNCEMMFTLLLHLIQKKVFSFFWLFSRNGHPIFGLSYVSGEKSLTGQNETDKQVFKEKTLSVTLRPRTSFSLSLDYHTRSLGFTCRCDRHYSNQLSRLSMSPQFNCIRFGWRTLLTLRSQVAWTICETTLRGGFSILRARRTLAHGRPGFSGLVSRALCQLTGPAPQPQSSAGSLLRPQLDPYLSPPGARYK